MLCKKLRISGTAVIILITIFLSATVFAAALQSPDFLDPGQTVNGPGFFSGNLVQVNGTVDGTTFVFGQKVRINGTINGDLIVAAQDVYINGKVSGNIYSAGQSIVVDGQNTGDMFLAAQSIDFSKSAAAGRDLFAAGQTILLQGSVQRMFFGGGSSISISGSVGRDAKLEGNKINVQDGAVINGDFSYKSPNKANISETAKITGKTDWEYKEPAANRQNTMNAAGGRSLWGVIWSIAGALLIWFLIKIWRPDFWEDNTESLLKQPLKAIGTGLLAFITVPIMSILFMITVIGVPLGIILLLIYGISLYISKIIAAVFISILLSKRFQWTKLHKGVWAVLLGLVIVVILSRIPVIGFLLWLLVVFAGLGTLIQANYKVKRSKVEMAAI